MSARSSRSRAIASSTSGPASRCAHGAHAGLGSDVKLWLYDGNIVELGLWRPVADTFVGNDIREALDRLRGLQAEMDTRYRQLDTAGRRKIVRTDGLDVILCVIDELAYFSVTIGTPQEQDEFKTLVRDLVARGRAAGVIVCAATQKPASDVVPSALRDLFGFRLALRCNTPQASDTILGQGWATLGHSAASIAPAQRGVGLLLANDGTPVRMRGFHLTDADVDALAGRAAAQRAKEWLAAAEGAGS